MLVNSVVAGAGIALSAAAAGVGVVPSIGTGAALVIAVVHRLYQGYRYRQLTGAAPARPGNDRDDGIRPGSPVMIVFIRRSPAERI